MNAEQMSGTSQRMKWLGVLGLLVLGVLIPNSPVVKKIPGRDSGIHLYVGRTVLQGGIPYRDGWDHKPPGIYFLNALGLFVGGGSWWGVWVLEFISLSVATILGFLTLQRSFGMFPALFGSVAWLVSLCVLLEGGNLTEEYALPYQFAALYLFMVSESRQRYGWRGFVMGLATAAAFCLRQNLIGVSISVVLYIVFTRIALRNYLRLLVEAAAVFSGVAAGLTMVVVYFVAHDAWADF